MPRDLLLLHIPTRINLMAWFQRCDSEGDAACATDNHTRPQRRPAARARCVVGIQDGGVFVCQLQRFLVGIQGGGGGVCVCVSINAF